jgi:hypothetical protein
MQQEAPSTAGGQEAPVRGDAEVTIQILQVCHIEIERELD